MSDSFVKLYSVVRQGCVEAAFCEVLYRSKGFQISVDDIVYLLIQGCDQWKMLCSKGDSYSGKPGLMVSVASDG